MAGRVSVERPELGMELALFEVSGPRYLAFSWTGPTTARVFQGKEVTPAEAAAEFIRRGLPVPPGLPLPEGALSPVEVLEMTSGESIGAMEMGTGGGVEEPLASQESSTTPDASQPRTHLLSASDLERILSERLGRPCGGVDSFLARYRKNAVDCFEVVEAKRRTEPKILYRTADVWAILWEKYARKK